jgi:hypothetical protein
MQPITLALVFAPSFCQKPELPPRDPRTHALRTADAIYKITEVSGRIVTVPDCDGDGRTDLAVGRGGRWPRSSRVDLVSSRTGVLIRLLGELPVSEKRAPTWTAGADLNGDGVPDLLIGDPSAEGHLGRAALISGKDGSLLREIRGVLPQERFGCSVALLGDLDDDGCSDFAVGAEEFDPEVRLETPQVVRHESTSGPDGEQAFVVFADGSRMTWEALQEEHMRARSNQPGFVSVRSGKDGSELWRETGKHVGHAFGTTIVPVEDLDGDGELDLLVGSDLRALDQLLILSGKTGDRIASMDHAGGLAGPVGDLNGDGLTDLFLDSGDVNGIGRGGNATFCSGKTRSPLFTLRYPDMCSNHAVTVGMGDLDGDGIAEIAFGDGNFNIKGPGNPGYNPAESVDLSKLSLQDALKLASDPWCAFTWESGCAVVYSGRTREVIFGVWAEPGSREGLGVAVCPLPDLTGDGLPDVLVANGTTAFAFPGPGAEPK